MIVPSIPPRLRPKRGLQLYTILWEEPGPWTQDPSHRSIRRCCARLGGDLYIVLGVWDLTPLERAVLGGRADG